jgi:uncharacterized protein with FMN-binding domain
MKRIYIIGGAALVATVGSVLFPAGRFGPPWLVGEGGTINPGKTAGDGEKVLTGDAVETHYGTVQVQITVKGTEITAVDVLQSPTGPNQRYSDFAVPTLTEQALAAQSADIAGASGASYTSAGFIQSLQSALAQM